MSFSGAYRISMGIQDVAAHLTTEAAAIEQVTEMAIGTGMNLVEQGINELFGAGGSSVARELYAQFQVVKSDFKEIGQMFSEGMNVQFDFESSSTFLDFTNQFVDRAEKILDAVERAEEFVDKALDFIGDGVQFIENFGEKFDEIVNNISEKFDNLVATITNFDIANFAANLPDLLMNNLSSLSILKEPLLALQTIKTTVMSIGASIASLSAVPSLKSIREVLKKLREIASALDQAKNAVMRTQRAIEQIAKKVQNGEYVSLLLAIAQGGTSFFQEPMGYDAIYPFNFSYRTSGGFTYEQDNTKGKERTSFFHPAGTGYYINSDGSAVFKGTKNVQCTAENAEINATKDCNITAKSARIVVTGPCSIEASDNINLNTTKDININAGLTGALGGSISIHSMSNLNVTSMGNITMTGQNIEIAAQSLLTLTGGTSPAPLNPMSDPTPNPLGVAILSRLGGISLTSGFPVSVPPVQPLPGTISMKAALGAGIATDTGPLLLLALSGPITTMANMGRVNTTVGAKVDVTAGARTDIAAGHQVAGGLIRLN